MREALLLFFIYLAANAADGAELLSTGVGMVRGQVVTSREVQISRLLENVLDDEDEKRLRKVSVDSRAFARASQETLLESVIAIEAQNFNVVMITPEEMAAGLKKVNATLKGNAAWKELEPTAPEVESLLRRKLQAKKFVQFRTQSSIVPITDTEAQKYFNENRLKFGNLPFENFKENIKSFLSRTQVEKRLKDWYELLNNKYQVKSLIAEN